MKTEMLPELSKWEGEILKYIYKSYDEEYLRKKLNRIARLVDLYNSHNDKGFKLGHTIRETGYLQLGDTKKIEYTLDILVEPYEQHKRKENIDQQERDI